MKDAELAAVALGQAWRLPEPAQPGAWRAILEELVEAVARECEDAGAVVIGHVKALAVWPQGGYVRVSAVDTSHRATAELTAAAPTRDAELTLNVLVYGLADAAVLGVATGALARLATAAGAEIIARSAPARSPGHTHPIDDTTKGRKP
jgi:hypothetical protein